MSANVLYMRECRTKIGFLYLWVMRTQSMQKTNHEKILNFDRDDDVSIMDHLELSLDNFCPSQPALWETIKIIIS